MYAILMTMCRESRILPVFVTHSVEEAVFLASRVLVCDGPPLEIVEEIPVDTPLPRTDGSREKPGFERAFVDVQRAFARVRRQVPGGDQG